MTTKRRPKPQYMITYLCPHCGMDSGRTELDPPHCFYCDTKEGLKEIKREVLTPQVMADRLEKVTSRMMENLQKAWDIREKDGKKDDAEDMLLLKAMAKGGDLKEAIKGITKKMRKR